MTVENDDPDISLPLPVLENVDRLCDAFETALLAKEPVTIDAYLTSLEEQYRPTAYRELLALQLAYSDCEDRQVAEAAYTKQYPEYAAVTCEFFAALRRNIQVDSADGEVSPLYSTTGGPQSDLAINDPLPEKIGKYRIAAFLGSGGQGAVYRAIHPALHRDVVVKVSHRRFGANEAALRQLIQEGRVLADLDHPNLVRVYDLEFDQGRPYLVMDFVRGQNLRQYAQAKPVSPKIAATLLLRLTNAIAAVHSHGVVHLDIKPENIVIDDKGEPRLVDFGLATLRTWWTNESADEGAFRGTVAFASPEQAGGTASLVDHRSDIFSLGAVLFFLLVGKPPYYDAEWHDALVRAQACDFDRETIANCGIPHRLVAICLRAMNRDPKDRYFSTTELANDLRRFLNSNPRRSRHVAVAGGLAILFLAGSVYFASILLAKRSVPEGASQGNVTVSAESATIPDSVAGRTLRQNETVPVWDRQARELRLDGKVIRKIKSLKVAANIVTVLDSFQTQGWPRRIPCPFEGENDRQRLNDTVRSLNDGLDEIRFCVDGEEPGILWLLPPVQSKHGT